MSSPTLFFCNVWSVTNAIQWLATGQAAGIGQQAGQQSELRNLKDVKTQQQDGHGWDWPMTRQAEGSHRQGAEQCSTHTDRLTHGWQVSIRNTREGKRKSRVAARLEILPTCGGPSPELFICCKPTSLDRLTCEGRDRYLSYSCQVLGTEKLLRIYF